MSLINRVTRFLRSPQGRRAMAEAGRYARSPQARRHFDSVRRQITNRRRGRLR